MKTTFRMRACSLACMSCSTISPAVRLPTKPIVPVAQNVQPIWQPTWEETQTYTGKGEGRGLGCQRSPHPAVSLPVPLPLFPPSPSAHL